METNDSNMIASIVSVMLYFLAILFVAKILISLNYKLPEKWRWISKILDLPVVGPVAYWFYFMLTGKKKVKHKTHTK